MGNELRPRPRVGVCPDWPVPVTLQLAGQLQWAIASGQVPPGTVLPTVDRMAAAVGLNRNTVNAVYTELARHGLLELRRGTGTRVTDGAAVAGCQRRAPLLQMIDTCLHEAASLGFSPQEAAFFMLARAAWEEHRQRQRLRVGLVATAGCDAGGFAAALAEAAGCAVETVFLEDVVAGTASVGWNDWQVAVVRDGTPPDGPAGIPAALPRHLAVVPVSWAAAPALVQALAQLPPGAPVATVAATAPTARLMRSALLAAGLQHLRIFSGPVDDAPLLTALPHMVQVWADGPASAVLRERHPGLTVRPYAWTLAGDSRERVLQACEQARERAIFRNLPARGTV